MTVYSRSPLLYKWHLGLITLGHKMSHKYMHAQFVLGIRGAVVTTEVKPATCIQEYYIMIKIWG